MRSFFQGMLWTAIFLIGMALACGVFLGIDLLLAYHLVWGIVALVLLFLIVGGVLNTSTWRDA